MKTTIIFMAIILSAGYCAAEIHWRKDAAEFASSVPPAHMSEAKSGFQNADNALAEKLAGDFKIPLPEAARLIEDTNVENEVFVVTKSGKPVQVSRVKGSGKLKLFSEKRHDSVDVAYRDASGQYDKEALAVIKHFMRCNLDGKEATISTELIELLSFISKHFNNGVITVNSGYRSKTFNEWLIKNGKGAVSNSRHLVGEAADITIAGISDKSVQEYAKSLNAGGVGFYSNFTHVDVGPVRYWDGAPHKKKTKNSEKKPRKKDTQPLSGSPLH